MSQCWQILESFEERELAGVEFAGGATVAAGEDICACAVPGSDAAELGDGVAAEAVLDGEPIGSGEEFVMDVAAGSV